MFGDIRCLVLTFMVTAVVSPAEGFLNIYLTKAEVRRLLGLPSELYYVRDGITNDYALNFIITVHANVNYLHFTWQNVAGKPLPYSIQLQLSSQKALLEPGLNISSVGMIPSVPTTWSVELPCSGRMDDEIDVRINVNITVHRANHNVTQLTFKRKKVCLRGPLQGSQEQQAIGVDLHPTLSSSVSILYIAVGCACALIGVIVTMAMAYFIRTRKLRLEDNKHGSGNVAQAHTFLPVEMPVNNYSSSSCKSVNSYTSFKRMPNYSSGRDREKDFNERVAELTMQRCRVRLKSVVMEGTFGKVYRGTYAEEDGGEEEIFVKTVTDDASKVQITLLLQEGMSMYNLTHKNILPVMGVCVEDRVPPFLVYHYQGYGNLKRFLQKCKVNAEGVAHTLTTQEVVDMALQIVHAMQYLHKKKVLHRDLATRNCVVDDKLRVQITDNALSRDLFPGDYHCLGDNENRPIKWLAIESLTQKTFTTASDVWSFGVLLWELTTLAGQPYQEVDQFEMVAYLRDGYRLTQPINCPDELFAVMTYCWVMAPEERPTFTQLNICLQEFYAQLTRYV